MNPRPSNLLRQLRRRKTARSVGGRCCCDGPMSARTVRNAQFSPVGLRVGRTGERAFSPHQDTPKVVPNDKSSEHSTTNSETDLDSDAIFSALAKYAKLMTDPMDSLLEGEESSPVHTLLKTAPVASMAPVASIEEATSISPSDETNETAPDTCGHSMGSNDSGRVSPHHDTKKPTEEIEKPAQDVEKPVQIPEETCERVVRSNMKPSKLRFAACTQPPWGIACASTRWDAAF